MVGPSAIGVHNVGTITRQELATLVRDKTPGLAIIDVRDGDYVGGHIAGAINVPTQTHDYKIPELVRTLQNKDKVVFHCALSQQRGPSSALRYLRERERLLGSDTGKGAGDSGSRAAAGGQTVYVLQGGFVQWQEVYGLDKDLTEDYQQDIWEFGY